MKWNILTICLCIAIISAQVDQPCSFSTSTTVTLGVKNNICAKIIYRGNTFVYGFTITADKLTALSIKNLSYALSNPTLDSQTTNDNIVVQFQFQNSNKVTELLISNKSATVYRNLISIIIQVNNGIFQAIIDDSQDCSACNIGSSTCYQGYCYNMGYFLEQNNFFIYVSWIGTDINLQHMISYTQRLKKLSKYSFTNIYSRAFSIY